MDNFKAFIRSFGYAFSGIAKMMHRQRNFYVQLVAGIVAISAAYYFPLLNGERAIIVITIAVVLAAEIFNTAIEKLTDLVEPSYNKKATAIKDIAAAAVLVLALAALAVAAIIFLPYVVGFNWP